MTFDEFKKREWEVLRDPEPGPDAKHTPGDIVSFDGDPDGVVNVRCKRYGDASYNKQEDTIQGEGFVIRMIGKGPNGELRIRFEPDPPTGSGPIGGSWTAEDTGSGADGE